MEFAIGFIIGAFFGGLVGYGTGYHQGDSDRKGIISTDRQSWIARKKG